MVDFPSQLHLKLNVPMDLEDCDGMIMQMTIKDLQGRISLIEFVRPIIEG